MRCLVYVRAFYESPYLDAFIEHYCNLGFGKIIILKCDNIEFEVKHLYKEYVCIYNVQNRGNENLKKYSYLITETSYDWVLCVDVDEFLLFNNKYKCVQDFITDKLSENNNINGFHFRWGIIEKYDNIKKDYTLKDIVESYNIFSNVHIKSMTKISDLCCVEHPHCNKYKKNIQIYFDNKILCKNIPMHDIMDNSYCESLLIHIHTRSINNMVIKSLVTMLLNKHIKKEKEFEDEINTSDDKNILIENFKNILGPKAQLPFTHAKFKTIRLENMNLQSSCYPIINLKEEKNVLYHILETKKIAPEKYYGYIEKIEHCVGQQFKK